MICTLWQSSRILLKNLYEIQNKFYAKGEVYIKITGETDAVPISNLTYKNELGFIMTLLQREKKGKKRRAVSSNFEVTKLKKLL